MRIVILASLLMLGCANSGDSKPAAAAPLSFDGIWNYVGVQCFNADFSLQTSAATPANSFTESVSITNFQYIATNTYNTCTVQFAGDIAVSGSTLSIINRRVLGASGGSCAITMTITSVGITPTTSTTTYSNGQTLSAVSNVPYYYNASSGHLGLPSTYTNGIMNNLCFVVYKKQ